MVRSKNHQQLEFPDFYLPFSGHLDPKNRWIALARLVPWELAEKIYHDELCEDFGAPIVPARLALGALLVKERLGLSDRETVETIRENPYLQFFLGYEGFSQKRPFDASLMVDFRKRFGEEDIARISEAVVLASISPAKDCDAATPSEVTDDHNEPPTDNAPTDHNELASQETSTAGESAEPPTNDDETKDAPTNHGQLIVDATCAPADIRYPTDVSLLNEAREKTEELIDELHAPLVGKEARPRTYRVKARRAFTAFARRKKPRRNVIRRRFGCYPAPVHADKIYRTRANRAYCKQRGIRLSGPPLGRPPQHVSAADKKQATADEAIRNAVEGKFGQAKRRFGLGRVMAKLANTSTAQISLSFLVMNLEQALRRFFFSLIFAWHSLAVLLDR